MNNQALQSLRYSQVKNMLEKHGFIDKWGRKAPNILSHILYEVREGKSKLCVNAENDVLRMVTYVDVNVFFIVTPGFFLRLVEVRRLFNDGTERLPSHNASISIKVPAGKSYGEAAIMGLKNELGILESVSVDEVSTTPTYSRDVLSRSFPGLPAQRCKYKTACILPIRLFDIDANYRGKNLHRSIFFDWRPTRFDPTIMPSWYERAKPVE